MNTLSTIPWLLIALRMVAGPILILTAVTNPLPGWGYVLAAVAALISDIYDGILARRMGTATAALRIWDSRADIVFWLSTATILFLLHPDVLAAHPLAIGLILGLELVPNAIYLLRFGRQSASHSYLAKFWGLTLAIAISYIFITGHDGWPFTLTLAAGLACQAERITIALLLPAPVSDIPTAWHAWQIRQGREIRRNPLFHGKNE